MRGRTAAFFLYVNDVVSRLGLAVRRRWLRWSVGSLAVGVVTFFVAAAALHDGAFVTLQQLMVNVAASAVVAVAAFAGFSVVTRRHVVRRLLERQLLDVDRRDLAARPHQARAVVAQLVDRSHTGGVIVEAVPGSGRTAFVSELTVALAAAGVVAVVVPDGALVESTVVQAATDQFRRLLTLAGVSEAPLLRTLESLSARRRIAVIVDGLDATPMSASRGTIPSIVHDRARELAGALLPFVAIIDQGSTPKALERNRIALTAISGSVVVKLAADARRDARRNGTDAPDTPDPAAPEPRTLAVARRLAQSLDQASLSLKTARRLMSDRVGTMSDPEMLDDIRRVIATNGHLAYLLERLAAVGFPAGDRDSAASVATLELVAEHLFRYDTSQLQWSEFVAQVPARSIEDVRVGVDELERVGILERRDYRGRLYFRFTEPDLCELVVGAWLARSNRPFAHSVGRSRAAFAAELLRRAEEGGAAVWGHALDAAREAGVLTPTTDAHLVATAQGHPVPDPTVAWLEATWARSNDLERLLFLRRLPPTLPDGYLRFLWHRLVPPAFDITSHRVRWVIAGVIGERGDVAWDELNGSWHEFVHLASGAETPDGASGVDGRGAAEPKTPWERYGSAVASSSWILPQIAITASRDNAIRATELMSRISELILHSGQVRVQGAGLDETPDLGMEISLAEGYKVACNLALVHDQPVTDQLWDLVDQLRRDGRSWVSRLIAMQAAVLGVVSDPSRGDQWRQAFQAIARSRAEHPLSRRYAEVLAGLLNRPTTEQLRDIYRVVWVIDTESLATAGGDLDDEPAEILAAVTIVLNLVGARITKAGAQLRSDEYRVPALTQPRLPGCLDSALLARASTRQPCSCGMQLCGPDLDQEVRRPVSPTFAYRCLSREHEHSLLPSAAERWHHALDVHLRRFATNQANPTD